MSANRPCTLALSLLALASGCATAPSPRDVVERALERRGGRDRIAALVEVSWTEAGRLRGVPFREEVRFLPPNRLRSRFEFPGVGREPERGFDGRRAWVGAPDGPDLLEPEEKKALRERALDEAVSWLLLLDDPNYPLAFEGSDVFHGREVWTVRVNHWTGYERRLHFDRRTFDLVGRSGRTWTRFGRIPVDVVFSRFEEIQGVVLPRRVEIFSGTERVREAEIRDLELRFAPPGSER